MSPKNNPISCIYFDFYLLVKKIKVILVGMFQYQRGEKSKENNYNVDGGKTNYIYTYIVFLVSLLLKIVSICLKPTKLLLNIYRRID